MKVRVVPPNYLNSSIEVELDNFFKFDVNVKGLDNSNYFLLSLVRELNEQIGVPEIHRVPWAYFPNRFTGKKSSVISFGNFNSSISTINFLVSYRKKGDIDSVYFGVMLPHQDINYKYVFKNIVFEALRRMHDTNTYILNCKLDLGIKKLLISEYEGSRFQIYNDGVDSYLQFMLCAVSDVEAEMLCLERLNYFISFLSVETNLNVQMIEFSINRGLLNIKHDYNINLIGDYIDLYPMKDNMICLSGAALSFLENVLFQKRNLKLSKKEKYFLLGCVHFKEGVYNESKLEQFPLLITDTQIMSFSPKYIINKDYIITKSVTSYLSSIETVSFPDSVPEICPECKNIKYKISNRVYNFVSQYINKDIAYVFKEAYGLRSKYLHTGKVCVSPTYKSNIPLLDISTATGAADYGLFTIRKNSQIYSFSVSNLKEWTSYCFRCYYTKELI